MSNGSPYNYNFGHEQLTILSAVCLANTIFNENIFTCSVTGLTAVAMDVAVPRTNIREDSNGNPVLSFYVQFSSSVFLSADTLATAVKVDT